MATERCNIWLWQGVTDIVFSQWLVLWRLHYKTEKLLLFKHDGSSFGKVWYLWNCFCTHPQPQSLKIRKSLFFFTWEDRKIYWTWQSECYFTNAVLFPGSAESRLEMIWPLDMKEELNESKYTPQTSVINTGPALTVTQEGTAEPGATVHPPGKDEQIMTDDVLGHCTGCQWF